jgi:hypothetical protein
MSNPNYLLYGLKAGRINASDKDLQVFREFWRRSISDMLHDASEAPSRELTKLVPLFFTPIKVLLLKVSKIK